MKRIDKRWVLTVPKKSDKVSLLILHKIESPKTLKNEKPYLIRLSNEISAVFQIMYWNSKGYLVNFNGYMFKFNDERILSVYDLPVG